MVANVSVERDGADNIKPSKKKSTERIDGVSASINAICRLMLADGEAGSVYSKRGLIQL